MAVAFPTGFRLSRTNARLVLALELGLVLLYRTTVLSQIASLFIKEQVCRSVRKDVLEQSL